jgi:hypothetical protein
MKEKDVVEKEEDCLLLPRQLQRMEFLHLRWKINKEKERKEQFFHLHFPQNEREFQEKSIFSIHSLLLLLKVQMNKQKKERPK